MRRAIDGEPERRIRPILLADAWPSDVAQGATLVCETSPSDELRASAQTHHMQTLYSKDM
jgi:hypothetical protein